MKKIIGLLILTYLSTYLSAQKITGYIYDEETNETLPGVNIFYKYKGTVKGIISQSDGFYELTLPRDAVTITFSFLGFISQDFRFVVSGSENIHQNVYLKPETQLLNEVVVSVGRYEQKLSDITVSMNVLKPSDIERQSPTDLRGVLSTIPGVEVTDKQPSIRGGSGWTYGVGSRTLILVDGMSVLTPGVGEINWNLIPMENISQVEVIKGASSVLYGSSALNGLINVRTKRPEAEPSTRLSAYFGIYGDPDQSGYRWWDKDFWRSGKYEVEPFSRKYLLSGVRNPMYDGVDFSHTRRIGHFDVTAALNILTDEGYRQGGYNKRIRGGGNVTYHDQKISGMSYGLNINALSNEYGDFFIWRSPDNPYISSPVANMARQHNMVYVDPFFNYYNDERKTTHKVKSRYFFKSDNILSKGDSKELPEILKNMGTDMNSISKIIETINNPGELLPELVPPILEGDVNGLIEVVKGILKDHFPEASQEDYMDLISWVMQNPPPAESNDLPQWILGMLNPEKKSTKTDRTHSWFLDYQFSKQFSRGNTLTTGITYDHIKTDSDVSGSHKSDNIALFAQYDHKFFDRLNLSLGLRLEYYRVDEHKREAETRIFGTKVPFKPVFRGGLNYQLHDYTFLRASFGQGYRYPSIVEKFIVKDIGGVGAYPNKDLLPERGYNAEIGIKQGYQLGPFKGYLDLAGFYTYYKDMIEFNFGLINPNPDKGYPFITNFIDVIGIIMDSKFPSIGVKFANVSRAEIYGADFSITGMGNIFHKLKLYYNLGYTYTEPIDVKANERNKMEEKYGMLQIKSKSNTSKYLKYRQKHSVKGSFDFEWERISLGTNLKWQSKTLAVDYVMADERSKTEPDMMDHIRSLLFGDLHNYWKQNNKDYFTMDVRLGIQVTRKLQFQWMINNLLNEEYCVRPMDVSSPRTYIMKINFNF